MSHETRAWLLLALALGAAGCDQGSASAAAATTAAGPAAPAPPAAKPLTEAQIEALIKDLGKDGTRAAAQRQLGAAGAAALGPMGRAVDAQLKAKKSKDAYDRVVAGRMLNTYVEVLGVIGKPAIPLLRRIAAGDDTNVTACWALERLGEKCRK